jgi:hypothetical protein
VNKRNNKRFIGIAVAACVVAAVVFAVLCARGASADEEPHETRPLFDVLDSANMMLVTPVGLGEHAKGRVISGRTYQNFVQLLRLADAKETLLDTFHTECATGVRIQLFHDTLSVAELRVADKIGRVGDDIGVWEPEKPATMKKINQFMRNQGVSFRPCAIKDSSTDVSGVLESMILEQDTAIRTPLYEIAKNADRAEISWGLSCTRPRTTELTEEQLQEFISLLQNTKRESFSGGCLCLPRVTVRMFRDSVEILYLENFGDGKGLEKHLLESDFGAGGFWESSNPQAVKAFFDRLKKQVKDCRQKPEIPVERPVLILNR